MSSVLWLLNRSWRDGLCSSLWCETGVSRGSQLAADGRPLFFLRRRRRRRRRPVVHLD